jgi:hypothetical protein
MPNLWASKSCFSLEKIGLMCPVRLISPRAIVKAGSGFFRYDEEGVYTSIENLINGAISFYALRAVFGMEGFQLGDMVWHD